MIAAVVVIATEQKTRPVAAKVYALCRRSFRAVQKLAASRCHVDVDVSKESVISSIINIVIIETRTRKQRLCNQSPFPKFSLSGGHGLMLGRGHGQNPSS